MQKSHGNVTATTTHGYLKNRLLTVVDTEPKQTEGSLFLPNYITSHEFLLSFFSV